MERMRGWEAWWKCLVACLFFDESQQPTWPHSRQSRKCTQVSPVFTQSSHTCVSVLVNLSCFRCEHCPITFLVSVLPHESRMCDSAPSRARGTHFSFLPVLHGCMTLTMMTFRALWVQAHRDPKHGPYQGGLPRCPWI